MRYIDTEPLLKEINRIEEEARKVRVSGTDKEAIGADGKVKLCLKLKFLIDSLQQEQQEEPDKSLEEEVKNYFQGYWPGTETVEQCNTDLYFTPPAIIRFARHFAEWQKSQMLKDAYVESQIVEDGRIDLGGDPLPCLNPIILLPYPQFKLGDKVRIIVLKAEEK